jgi:MtaA/CmuA family methyltransferase
MSMTGKERYIAAMTGREHDRAPVTPLVMAWAAHHVGRTYRDYYLDGDVLVEAHLAMARDFGVDQVGVISDPWAESGAYGMEFDYPPEGVGIPRSHLIGTRDDLRKLRPLDFDGCGRTRQRIESVGKFAAAVGHTHSVLGWVEGPIAEYGDLRGVESAMLDLMDDPDMFAAAAEAITENAIQFARRQISAGADTVGVGDAAASLVGPELYRRCVLPWETKLIEGIHHAGAMVKLHICGNINAILADVATTGADAIDLDWMVPVAAARRIVGADVCLCGNFDPVAVLMQGTPETVADAARQCLAEGGDRFVLQPGCEVPPGTPEANLRAFCPADGCLIEADLRR